MKEEFLNDMDKNVMGNKQEVRQVGDYIIEYYSDSFTLERGKVRPRIQIFRKAKETDNHWRKWLMIEDFEDSTYSPSLYRELFETLTLEEIEDLE